MPWKILGRRCDQDFAPNGWWKLPNRRNVTRYNMALITWIGEGYTCGSSGANLAARVVG